MTVYYAYHNVLDCTLAVRRYCKPTTRLSIQKFYGDILVVMEVCQHAIDAWKYYSRCFDYDHNSSQASLPWRIF